MKYNSYFHRHQQLIKNNKSNHSKPKTNTLSEEHKSNFFSTSSIKLQESNPTPVSNTEENVMDIEFFEKTEEEKMYEEYKQLEKQYEEELNRLKDQMNEIQKKTQSQLRKVRQAEISLQSKKKQLKIVRNKHQQFVKNSTDEQRNQENNKIKQLKEQLQQLKQDNNQKILQLNEQYDEIVRGNNELKQKLDQLQQQYQKTLEFDPDDYETQINRLLEEQNKLKIQFAQSEASNEKIKKEIEKMEMMKPVSSQLHKKYLDLYEKMFISKEIAKAEQVLILKQQYKRQQEECDKRKAQIKEKETEIKLREKRIQSKNKIIETLTNQIREKSTTLLNMYQNQHQKSKKG